MKLKVSVAFLLVLIATGCAPVASSMPKMATTQPSNSGQNSSVKGDLKVRSSSTKVVATDVFQDTAKKVSETYHQYVLTRGEIDAFLANREVVVSLPVGAVRMDAIVMIEMKVQKKEINQELADQFKSEVVRDESQADQFHMVVSKDQSDEAWAYVKKYADTITLAYRESAIR